MKGSFFVVFMISLSIGAVLTAFILEKIGHVRKLYSGKAIVFLWAFATSVFLWYAVAFPYIALHSFTGDTQLVGIVSLSVVLGLFLAAPPVGVLGMVFFFRAWRKPKGEKIGDVAGVSRREFVTRAAFAVPIVTMGAAAFCNVQGSRHLALTRHTLYFPDLPDYLNGYRIAQISDPHMGLFFRPQQLGEAMELAAYAGADRLEITGDLIDELSLLRPCRDILQEKGKIFRDGMDFCYGNHEYYRNVEKITAMLRTTGIRILKNTSYCVSAGGGVGLHDRGGNDPRSFYIGAVDFSFAKGKRFAAERRQFMERTLQSVRQEAFFILLAHHPAFIREAFAAQIPLTLCGHTHGGQIAPLAPMIRAGIFPYLRGLYSNHTSYAYVNRGTGDWLPVRILCSREVSVFELRKGKRPS